MARQKKGRLAQRARQGTCFKGRRPRLAPQRVPSHSHRSTTPLRAVWDCRDDRCCSPRAACGDGRGGPAGRREGLRLGPPVSRPRRERAQRHECRPFRGAGGYAALQTCCRSPPSPPAHAGPAPSSPPRAAACSRRSTASRARTTAPGAPTCPPPPSRCGQRGVGARSRRLRTLGWLTVAQMRRALCAATHASLARPPPPRDNARAQRLARAGGAKLRPPAQGAHGHWCRHTPHPRVHKPLPHTLAHTPAPRPRPSSRAPPTSPCAALPGM